MLKCCDPHIGQLLPSYELQALSEEDVKLFEIHVMHCEYCLNEISSFEKYAHLMRHSNEAREAMKDAIRVDVPPISIWEKLSGYLWPDVPLIFKPALSLVLVLLLAIPAFYGIQNIGVSNSEVRPVQTIRLMGTRTTGENTFTISSGLDGVIVFTLPNATAYESYDVVVTDAEDNKVFQLNNFDTFNKLGIAEFLLPQPLMNPGLYRLKISHSTPDTTILIKQYRFRITK